MTTAEIRNEFGSVAIIGLGLMGGSLAMGLRRKVPGLKILAVDFMEVIQLESARSMIDEGFTIDRLSDAISQADLVVIATPIRQILELLPRIAACARPGTLITDMGSTKSVIVKKAAAVLPETVYFIGGHPMAGSEGRSHHAADPLLFENAVFVLTPGEMVPPLKVQALGNLYESMGAKVLFLSPALHDRIAAAVSHLPQLLAVSLTNLVSGYQTESSHFLKLAAGGFRDMTRIAASPWELWSDIIRTNQLPVVEFIDRYIDQLESVKAKVMSVDLKTDFITANKSRLSIPRDTRGFLKPQFDLIVWVEDKPGVIAGMAAALAGKQINIKDIEVLKVREGDAGTFRLALESETDRQAARQILMTLGYNAKNRNHSDNGTQTITIESD